MGLRDVFGRLFVIITISQILMSAFLFQKTDLLSHTVQPGSFSTVGLLAQLTQL